MGATGRSHLPWELEKEVSVCPSLLPTGILPADLRPQTCYIVNYSALALCHPHWLCRKTRAHRHKQNVWVVGSILGANCLIQPQDSLLTSKHNLHNTPTHIHSLLCE